MCVYFLSYSLLLSLFFLIIIIYVINAMVRYEQNIEYSYY